MTRPLFYPGGYLKYLEGKIVLVTGAASGIGRGTALAFARAGSTLLLVDIDRGGLNGIEACLNGLGVEYRSFMVDVSSVEEIREMASSVLADYGAVDVLVNAAGVAVGGDFADITLEDWEWIVGINLWGPIYTINAFLPGMIARRSGHIVNVSSAGGFFAASGLAAYCATKFALVGLSEALLQEVLEHNVMVTTVCPGLTNTRIHEHARLRGVSHKKTMRQLRFLLSHGISAEKTGEIIVRAVERDRPVVITTTHARLVYYLKRVSPALYRALARFGRVCQNRFQKD